MIVSTVNVVLIRDGVTHSLWSFDNSKEAEECYIETIHEITGNPHDPDSDFDSEQIQYALDTGYVEYNNFAICIIHSEQ